MGLPTRRDAHINSALTDFAISFGYELPSPTRDATTNKRVDKSSDYYYVWDKGDLMRSEMDVRAPGSRSRVAGFRLSSTTYTCQGYSLAVQLPDEDAKDADLDLEKAKVRYLMHQVILKRAKIMGSAVFATGLWTGVTEQTGVTGSSPSTNQFQWWNESGSTPLEDIHTQMQAVKLSCGMMPNVAICNSLVLQTLQRHASITDLYKYTQGGLPTQDLVAGALGLDKIVVLDHVQNTAVEGATATMARVFGNHMLLAYIDPNPSTETPTAITTFAWSDFDQVDANGAEIRSWYEDSTRSTYFQADMYFDCKITAQDSAVFLYGCIG